MLALVAAASIVVKGEQGGLDPKSLLRPLSDSWPTFSGDYSGRRYSTLAQVTRANVKNLSLVWTTRLTAGAPQGPEVAPPFAPRPPRTLVGGVGDSEFVGGTTVKGSILMVDGVLYVTAPDNVWALDAADGHLLWRYFWRTRGGTHIGNRGAAMWRNYLFFVTPDDYIVSLDARTGEERWHKEIANFNQQYFLTSAPTVVDNHVLIGSGNDLDSPGYLLSLDPETGNEQWRFWAVPMNAGDPGLESWKNLDAARNGGGHPWMPGSYDPEQRLYIVGTGNPTPAYTGTPRGEGDNLFTNCVVAIDVDTGKMKWYYQTNPHDTHDWDSAQTPMLVDAELGGRMRKLVVTAARNGYYFTLDRTTGERLVTSKFSDTVNWAKGLNDKGQPVRDPAKDHDVGGALVSSNNSGATNWPAQSFSPQTGLAYVPLAENYAMYYLTELDPRGAMGLGGKDEVGVSGIGSYIAAIDYKTGKTVWRHKFATATPSGRGSPGLLTTAGRLLFGGDVSGNFVAFDAGTGTPLWHSRIGQVSNAPQTYLVDGRQHVLVAAGDQLFAFAVN
jgi:alcohol dehydrogenase (cytochrome c)